MVAAVGLKFKPRQKGTAKVLRRMLHVLVLGRVE